MSAAWRRRFAFLPIRRVPKRTRDPSERIQPGGRASTEDRRRQRRNEGEACAREGLRIAGAAGAGVAAHGRGTNTGALRLLTHVARWGLLAQHRLCGNQPGRVKWFALSSFDPRPLPCSLSLARPPSTTLPPRDYPRLPSDVRAKLEIPAPESETPSPRRTGHASSPRQPMDFIPRTIVNSRRTIDLRLPTRFTLGDLLWPGWGLEGCRNGLHSRGRFAVGSL